MLRTGKEHVDPVRCAQEATIVLRVATNKGDDDDLCLLTLEIIDSCKPDALEKRRLGNVLLPHMERHPRNLRIQSFQLVKVPLINAHRKGRLHRQTLTEFLQLAQVWGQYGDIIGIIVPLFDEMRDNGCYHPDLEIIRV